MTEYLTRTEVAARLKLDPKTVSKMKKQGIFVQGVHYYYRRGEIGVRFDWDQVEKWLKQNGQKQEGGIPMANGGRAGI